jgi:hypothetical protein
MYPSSKPDIAKRAECAAAVVILVIVAAVFLVRWAAFTALYALRDARDRSDPCST